MKRLLFLLVLVSHSVFANTDTKFNTLTGSALVAGASQTVGGLRYNATGSPVALSARNFWVQNVYGLVKLSVPTPSSTQGSASVGVSITYQTEALIADATTGIETLQYVSTTTTATLSVNLSGTDATDVSYFLAPNAQNVQITVTSVSNASNLNLTLTTSVVTIGFDYLAANASVVPTHLSQNMPVITSGGDLQVSWSRVTGASTYELEWTFISNQGMDPVTLIPFTLSFNQIAIPPLYFKNNSSRVETANVTYNIPLIFEQGYILYRVRAVGQNIVNSNPVWVKSAWSYLDAGSPGDITGQTTSLFPSANAYLYAGLENNINWQSSLSFAEEGKNKVVVSYHDGSSRNRQAVTRINTDQRTIAGETMYDYNGRPIIQTLPVPLSNQALGLSPNLNYVNNNTKVLSKADITQDGCVTTGPQLSAASGSSQYYSSSNTFDGTSGGNTGNNVLNKDNIPDAQLYPYSQTVYTADNTGRIATQSGIGKTNSLGSGKETQYMYATPLQTELCRLFGTNVGQAVHYKKNAVIDPNGQTSVSYLDMDGKVVATALAGVNPPTSNLDNLTGNGSTARNISEDLIQTNPGTNLLSADGTSKVFNKKFIVTGNQTSYTFDYNGTFGYYDIPCKIGSTSSTLNIDGVVDVYMTLQDKCGAILFSKDAHTAAGNTGQNQTATISNVQATLNAGTYQLVKEAVINEDKFQAYIQQYLASSCAMQLSDFQAAAQPVDLAQCNLTCESCNAQVATLISGGLLTPEQITTIQGLCDQVCDKTVGCSSYINAMMADMSPNGQYAKITPDRVTLPQTLDATQGTNGSYAFTALDNITVNNQQGSDISNAPAPQNFPLSIYNINNSLPIGSYLNGVLHSVATTKEYWRYPIFITRSGDNIAHSKNYQILLDENNNISLGDVNGNGSTANFKIDDYLDANGQTFFVYINKIVTVNPDQSTTTTYSPDVADVNKLVLVDATANLYKIPARWLKNISDFQNVWQSQWAYNLLPYHPEFPYYVDCITRDASNDFDYQVSSIVKQSDAVAAGLINADGTPTVFEAEGQYKLYGSQAVDAHPGPEAFYKIWMKIKMDNYQGSGSSIALMANQIVNCPNGSTAANACGIDVGKCTKTTIDSDDEWTTYWALYSSIKQEFIKEVANFKAVNGAYYNGCIGDVNYIGASDAWYFDQTKVFSTNSSSLYCLRFPFVGTRCGWFPYNYTVNVPSFMVPNQLCYYGNAGHFADKTRRFFPSTETSASSSNGCASASLDPSDPNTTVNAAASTITGPTYYVQPVPCATDAKSQMDAATLQAQITQYELCGTCPIASDVEALLSQLTSTNTLTSTNVTANCPNSTITLGGVLSSYVLSGIGGTPVVSWSGSLSGDKRTLTGTILAGTTTRYTVTLSVPASTNPITASTVTQPIVTTAYTLDQLLSLCCITASTTTQGAFTIRASFSGDGLSDIYLNGTITGLNLTDCSFLPTCVLTSDAVHTATFLNILSAVPTGTGANQTQLFSTTPVNLFDNSGNNLTGTSNLLTYVDVVIDLLNIPEASATAQLINTLSPVWTVNTQNSGNIIVSGTLSYSLDGGVTTSTQTIQVTSNGVATTATPGSLTGTIPSGATLANKPTQFISLATLPYDSHNSCTNCPSFGASMNFVTNNSFTAQPVIINTPFLNPVNCTPVVPATVNR